jgi:hypothetical protein
MPVGPTRGGKPCAAARIDGDFPRFAGTRRAVVDDAPALALGRQQLFKVVRHGISLFGDCYKEIGPTAARFPFKIQRHSFRWLVFRQLALNRRGCKNGGAETNILILCRESNGGLFDSLQMPFSSLPNNKGSSRTDSDNLALNSIMATHNR